MLIKIIKSGYIIILVGMFLFYESVIANNDYIPNTNNKCQKELNDYLQNAATPLYKLNSGDNIILFKPNITCKLGNIDLMISVSGRYYSSYINVKVGTQVYAVNLNLSNDGIPHVYIGNGFPWATNLQNSKFIYIYLTYDTNTKKKLYVLGTTGQAAILYAPFNVVYQDSKYQEYYVKPNYYFSPNKIGLVADSDGSLTSKVLDNLNIGKAPFYTALKSLKSKHGIFSDSLEVVYQSNHLVCNLSSSETNWCWFGKHNIHKEWSEFYKIDKNPKNNLLYPRYVNIMGTLHLVV